MQLPPLFRDIFKSAYLPYRSPETLGLFLKEISYFDYAHPEDLGDAYEYLLSIMSSQGDAGQFRTPRNIIDFMVDVVNPTKDDKVLDPACGTGGFLVSSYKHIVEQHDGKDDPEKKEKPLTPEQRKKLFTNFEGYDIDPSMVRIAQVNMYLHQFKNPQVSQYDSLTQEEHWGEKYDVILANPPFMSPQGGIRPHNKFNLPSNRSEVLFVDYIMNHLKPKGRAGIIVPEGIIFKSDNATKALRKALVEDGLYAVVSLPAGVFNPYAGVKTSILLFDNEHAKQSDELLFVKVENDGFDLGAQRRPINKNDLPEALRVLSAWREGKKIESPLAQWVLRKVIAETGDYNLSTAKYFETNIKTSDWNMVELGNLVEIRTGKKDVNQGNPEGQYPFFTCAKEPTSSDTYSFDTEAILVAGNGDVGAVKYYKGKFEAYQRTYVLSDFKPVILSRYLYFILENTLKNEVSKQKLGNTMPYIKVGILSSFKVPLPPLGVQKQIASELDGYQKIIDGARQIVDNWNPSFIQSADYELHKMSQIIDLQEGPGIMAVDFKEDGVPLVRLKGLENNFASLDGCNFLDPEKAAQKWSHFKLKLGDILLSSSGSLGRVSEVGPETVGAIAYTGIIRFRPVSKNLDQSFLKYYLLSNHFIVQAQAATTGVGLKHFGPTHLKTMDVALPPIEVQQQIVKEIEAERTHVESACTLIALYTQKTTSTIAKLWSE